MNDVEMHVRTVLADLADGAPPSAGLVEAVHTRGRRARRRRLAVAGVAASVAVLVAGAASIPFQDADSTLKVAAPVAAESGLPPAPVHLGKLPDGFSEPRVSIFDTGRWRIWSVRRDPGAELQVSISAAKPAVSDWPGSESETVTLDGRPATLFTAPINEGGSIASLTFEREPGQWVVVAVLNDDTDDPFAVIGKDQLGDIATGLTDEPTPVAQLLRIGAVPGSLPLCGSHDGSGQQYDTSQVTLCTASGKDVAAPLDATLPAAPDNAAVQLYWQHIQGKWWRDQQKGTHRAKITVDGREGEVAEAGPLRYGWIRLTNGVVVNVETREPNLFTREEFVAFLGGLRPGDAMK